MILSVTLDRMKVSGSTAVVCAYRWVCEHNNQVIGWKD